MSDDEPDGDLDDDPFERLDAPADADPFADLDAPDAPDAPDDHDAPDATDAVEEEPTSASGEPSAAEEAREAEAVDGTDGAGYAPPGPDSEETAFGADAVDRSDTAAATPDATDGDDPFGSFEGTAGRSGDVGDDDPFGAFESVDVEGADPDTVWAELATAEAGETPEFDEKVFYEVSKHSFCENCEYFSAPPDVECTYDGAAIVEFMDMEQVRLLNCPVVAEQRALEQGVNDIGSGSQNGGDGDGDGD
jgi:hypothetical protein